MRIARLMIIAISLWVASDESPAQVQQGNDQAAADQLFIQGRELLEQGKLDEAYARFEASQLRRNGCALHNS